MYEINSRQPENIQKSNGTFCSTMRNVNYRILTENGTISIGFLQ